MVGTEQVAPLARMWRSVYQKAAEVAEARTQELLKYHVYVYPHGGGGGGGLVELGRAVATAGQVTLRVPASGALPTGYSGLVVVGTGRNAGASGNRDVYLFFNDDTTTTHYRYSTVAGNPGTGAVTAGGSDSAGAIHLGFAPPVDAAHPETGWGGSGAVPLHEGTAFPQTGQFLSQYQTATELTPRVLTTAAVYAPAPPAALTSVALRCLTAGWLAGSTLVVYGHPTPA